MDSHAFFDVHPDDSRWSHHYGSGADDVRLHYVRQGRGPTIVLLHGWPGFWYDWRHVIPRLAPEADVIAPDFRGFGDSDKPDRPPAEAYTPRALANDILALLNHLGLHRVILGAHDIGATVAQVLARTAPDRIVALALFNPPYPGIGMRRFEPAVQPEFWYQHFHNLPLAKRLAGYNRDTVRTYLAHFYDHWLGRKETLRPAEFDAIVEAFARPGALWASMAYYRARAAARLKEAQEADPQSLTVQQPTAVLWGEADPVMRVEWSDRLPEFFASWCYRELPGVGHFVPFEAPDEAAGALSEALHVLAPEGHGAS